VIRESAAFFFFYLIVMDEWTRYESVIDMKECARMGCTVRTCRPVFAYTHTRGVLVATMPCSRDENEKGISL